MDATLPFALLAPLFLAGCSGSSADSDDDKPPSDTAKDTSGDSPSDSDSGPVDTAYQPDCDRSLPWTYVAAGLSQTCGIHSDGCAECWGIGLEQGGAADDTGVYHWEGEDRPPAGVYTAIAMPVNSAHGWGQHACGLLEGGAAVCWGEDRYGETDVVDGEYALLAVNEWATYAVGPDGALTTWGLAEPPDLTGVIAIDVEEYFGLSLQADGTLSQWAAYYPPNPQEVVTFDGEYLAADIAWYACAVSLDGTIQCWVPQDLDWVPDPDDAIFYPPEGDFVDVCIEDLPQACGLERDGNVTCWGGYEDIADVPQPVGVTFTQIACGSAHSCGLTPDGQIRCWGANDRGQCDTPT